MFPLDQEGRLLTTIERHPLVSLLGAQDRVAIVEGTLEVSEGHGSWGTVLGTEVGGSEAGTDSGESRKSGRVANIFGGMSGEAAGLQGRLGGSWRWTELTGNWQRRYSWVSPQHSSSLGNL